MTILYRAGIGRLVCFVPSSTEEAAILASKSRVSFRPRRRRRRRRRDWYSFLTCPIAGQRPFSWREQFGGEMLEQAPSGGAFNFKHFGSPGLSSGRLVCDFSTRLESSREIILRKLFSISLSVCGTKRQLSSGRPKQFKHIPADGRLGGAITVAAAAISIIQY